MNNPSNILQKHRVGKEKSNTITYVEKTKEDFSIGTLKGVEFKDGALRRMNRLDETCELYIDGTFPCVDKSPRPKPLTVNCAVWQDEEKGDVLTFKANHYIRLDEDIVFGKYEDFTLEFKLKRIDNNISAGRHLIGDNNSAPYFRWCLMDTGSYSNGRFGGSTFGIHNAQDYIPVGKWVTIAFERCNGRLRMYVDGKVVYTFTSVNLEEMKIKKNTTFMNWLSDANSAATHFANAHLREIVVCRKALYGGENDDESTSYRLSPEITLPEDTKSVSINWEGLGKVSLVEDNWKDHDALLTLSNGELYIDKDTRVVLDKSTVVPTNFKGYTRARNFIKSQSQYIKITNPLQKFRATDDFTIEATVTLKELPTVSDVWPTNFAQFYEIYGVGTTGPDGHQLVLNSTKISFVNREVPVLSHPHNAKVGETHHYAVCRKGDTIRLFIDGICVQEKEYTTHLNRGDFVYIGCEHAEGAYMNGYIHDLRVFHRAKYDSNFICEHKPYVPFSETEVAKKKPIQNIPHKFRLKEEVRSGEEIANVEMEIKIPMDEVVTTPEYSEDGSILYLYKGGDECVDVTGGYSTLIQHADKWTNQNLAEKHPNFIDVHALGLKTKNSIATKNPIPFARYNKMFMDVTVISKSDVSGELGLYAYNNIYEESNYMPAGKAFKGTEGRTIIEVNVSKINGHYWVGAYAAADSEAVASHFMIHNIWLQE